MRIKKTNVSLRSDCRGAALVAVAIMMIGVAMMSLALITVGRSAANAQRQSMDESGALYVAEAGLADALCSLESGNGGDKGSENARVAFGGTSYWVDTTDNGDGTLSVVSTGIDGRGGARVELVVKPSNEEFFRWGSFGHDWLHLDDQAKIDSYKSSLGDYSSQEVNGSGSSSYALDNGSTGSNGDIYLEQDALVYGDSTPGMDGTITILDNALVSGSTAPLDELVELPEIDLPPVLTTGPLDIAVDDTANIGPGEVHFTRLSADTGSTLHVTGPATVIFDTFAMNSGSTITVDAEDGPVQFFVQTNFVMHSNTTIASTSYTPGDIAFNLLSDNIVDFHDEVYLDNLGFDSDAKFYGTIYAPHALVNINSNFELFGSLVAQQVALDSTCRIHFDEDLLKVGEEGGSFTTLCWRELPYRPSKEVLAGN